MSEDDDGWLFDAWGDGEYTTVDLVLEHVLAQPAPVVDKRWAKLMLATLDTCERSDSMPEEPLGKALAAGAQQMTDAVRARVEELTERFDVELPGGT